MTRRKMPSTCLSAAPCLLLALCQLSGAATPRVLDGNALKLVGRDEATYAVRQTLVKTGGLLPGQYTFTFKLRLSIDAPELKRNAAWYQGRPVLPLRAWIDDLAYTAIKPSGERHEDLPIHGLTYGPDFVDTRGRRIRVKRPPKVLPSLLYEGRWDTQHCTFKFEPNSGRSHSAWAFSLAGVWVPALVVQFPERMKAVEGFSWGERPKAPPRHLEHVCLLQRWRVAGVEEKDGRLLLTLTAESRAAAAKDGPRCSMSREVVYDAARRCVVRAKVDFQTHDAPETTKASLVLARVEP